MTPSDYARRIERHREEKDEFFAQSRQSPIPPSDRDGFAGLEYFAPDAEYRFELPLDEHGDREPIAVATTMDGEREYRRWGEFRFEIDGTPVSLQAYKTDPDEDRLWVPFRDATNGEETYGAGRYLDLDADERRTNSEWILDLNEAYNPFCAYSHRFECPTIPMENWLDVRIEAGEKAYESGGGLDASSLHGKG